MPVQAGTLTCWMLDLVDPDGTLEELYAGAGVPFLNSPPPRIRDLDWLLGSRRPGPSKRLSEFLGGPGKRFSEFLGGPGKRYSEFLGGPGKRYSEFLGGPGKRSVADVVAQHAPFAAEQALGKR